MFLGGGAFGEFGALPFCDEGGGGDGVGHGCLGVVGVLCGRGGGVASLVLGGDPAAVDVGVRVFWVGVGERGGGGGGGVGERPTAADFHPAPVKGVDGLAELVAFLGGPIGRLAFPGMTSMRGAATLWIRNFSVAWVHRGCTAHRLCIGESRSISIAFPICRQSVGAGSAMRETGRSTPAGCVECVIKR